MKKLFLFPTILILFSGCLNNPDQQAAQIVPPEDPRFSIIPYFFKVSESLSEEKESNCAGSEAHFSLMLYYDSGRSHTYMTFPFSGSDCDTFHNEKTAGQLTRDFYAELSGIEPWQLKLICNQRTMLPLGAVIEKSDGEFFVWEKPQ